MGTTPRPPRRIVPPSVSAAPGAGSPVAYSPPKYDDPSRSSWAKILLIGVASFVLVAGGVFAVKFLMPPQDPAILAAIEERKQEVDAGGIERAKDATAAGWVGVIEMPIERAIVTISTVADDGQTAREFNDGLTAPVTLAHVEIDNRKGSQEIVLDTSEAVLTFTDGNARNVPDAKDVIKTAKPGREHATEEHTPPFRCPPGQKLVERYMFLPRGTDPQKIESFKVTLNAQPARIVGSYMSSAQKSAAKHNQEMRSVGSATTAPAGL
jgi:hypothetical protein